MVVCNDQRSTEARPETTVRISTTVVSTRKTISLGPSGVAPVAQDMRAHDAIDALRIERHLSGSNAFGAQRAPNAAIAMAGQIADNRAHFIHYHRIVGRSGLQLVAPCGRARPAYRYVRARHTSGTTGSGSRRAAARPSKPTSPARNASAPWPASAPPSGAGDAPAASSLPSLPAWC